MDFMVPITATCPFCMEEFELLIDTSQGDASFIEDCSVCCRPIQFHAAVSPGRVESFSADPA